MAIDVHGDAYDHCEGGSCDALAAAEPGAPLMQGITFNERITLTGRPGEDSARDGDEEDSFVPYDRLMTNCLHSRYMSNLLDVPHASFCQRICEETNPCEGFDSNGTHCLLSSHCEGDLGECPPDSAWCGYRSTVMRYVYFSTLLARTTRISFSVDRVRALLAQELHKACETNLGACLHQSKIAILTSAIRNRLRVENMSKLDVSLQLAGEPTKISPAVAELVTLRYPKHKFDANASLLVQVFST